MQSPGGGRSAHSRERAAVGTISVKAVAARAGRGQGGPCFNIQRRSRQPPPPPQGEGVGGRGRTDYRPQAAQGGGRGAGRGRGGAAPGERGPPPHDRRRPERSKPEPQGRAEPGRRPGPPELNKTRSFVVTPVGVANPTKLVFCSCSSVGCRRRTLAAERSAPTSRKSSEKRVMGASAMGGYYDTPPRE